MAGQLWGAHLGKAAIPTRWLADLEMADTIRQMAIDLAAAYPR